MQNNLNTTDWIAHSDSLFHQIFLIVMGGLYALAFLAGFTYKIIELKGIDFIVNLTGKIVVFTSSIVRRIQTGNTGFYIFAMVIGIVVILMLNLLNK